MREEIYHQFCEILGSSNVYQRESMAKHTTFRIGGEADYYLCPHSSEEIKEILKICRKEELPGLFWEMEVICWLVTRDIGE